MEQYYLPKSQDFKNFRTCISNYKPTSIYIRDCGGTNTDGSYRVQGLEKVSLKLKGHELDFKKDKGGLHILVDQAEVFTFPLRDHDKGFSVAYQRLIKRPDGSKIYHMPSTGIDPHDPALPEPEISVLRHLLDSHLMEITYPGRINLEYHSWWKKPIWKYWTIVAPKPKGLRSNK